MRTIAYHIGDTHFYHDKIIKYCNRPFKTVEEMNIHIINQWNSVVKEDDIVFHHGDVALNSNKEMVKDIVSQLNGYKILIMGNHDRRGRGWFLDIGFNEVYKREFRIGDYIFSHSPVEDLEEGLINIHGHIHNYDKGLDKEKYINVSCEMIDYKPIWLEIFT